ncbi:MAG: hypothetical protein KAJ19_14025 [Gammaproteobacteria bacterium]|nr:hypothetical protein [Gammaproteobacteria bacterium]
MKGRNTLPPMIPTGKIEAMASCHKCGKHPVRKRRCPHCGPLPPPSGFIGFDLASGPDRSACIEAKILPDGTIKVERIFTVVPRKESTNDA